MKKSIYFFSIFIFLLTSCQKESLKNDRVDIRINGFKKGKVFLNKLKNGLPEPVDSITVKGTDSISFDLSAFEPQLMLITIKDIPNKYILFFSDDTVNKIYTSLAKFGLEKYLLGGNNLKKWQYYQEMVRTYNDRKLDLMKEEFEASQKNDTAKLNKIRKKTVELDKRIKRFALNFVFENKNLPVSAYAALVEFHNNPEILDTIYKSFPQRVKQSLYAKEIKKILDSIHRPE